jgi:hypothetical protein
MIRRQLIALFGTVLVTTAVTFAQKEKFLR